MAEPPDSGPLTPAPDGARGRSASRPSRRWRGGKVTGHEESYDLTLREDQEEFCEKLDERHWKLSRGQTTAYVAAKCLELLVTAFIVSSAAWAKSRGPRQGLRGACAKRTTCHRRARSAARGSFGGT